MCLKWPKMAQTSQYFACMRCTVVIGRRGTAGYSTEKRWNLCGVQLGGSGHPRGTVGRIESSAGYSMAQFREAI